MRSGSVLLILVTGFLLLNACGPRESTAERQRDANTPAGKVGQAAHKAAVEADKAGRVIDRELKQAAHDARAGWKEDARKQREKQ